MQQVVEMNQQGNPVTPLTMSSLEIAELTGKTHDNVKRDIKKIAKDLSITFDEKPLAPTGGRPAVAFMLPRREVDILLTGYSIPLRARVIDRWRELEEQVAKPQVSSIHVPTNLREALLLAAELEEKRMMLEHKVEQDAPKVAFHDHVAEAVNCHTMEEAAKVLGTGRNRLFKFCRERGIMAENSRLPYQSYIDQGYFTVKEREFTDRITGLTHISAVTLVTGKGITYLQKKFVEV